MTSAGVVLAETVCVKTPISAPWATPVTHATPVTSAQTRRSTPYPSTFPGPWGAARFLGYDLRVGHNQRYHRKGRRAVNGEIQLSVPDEVVRSAAAPYLAKGEPGRRAAWM